MIHVKMTAGSNYIQPHEKLAIDMICDLFQHEEGYIIPILLVGRHLYQREVDAIFILNDLMCMIELKNWECERIEVDGANAGIRIRVRRHWQEKENKLVSLDKVAKIVKEKLSSQRHALRDLPLAVSLMVFSSFGCATRAEVSFNRHDSLHPEPDGKVCACHIDQLPWVISRFRTLNQRHRVELLPEEMEWIADHLIANSSPAEQAKKRRIGSTLYYDEHHYDAFLDCTIYYGKDETYHEARWVKKYPPVFQTPAERPQKEQLILRQGKVLGNLPAHKHIVSYIDHQKSGGHLYIILKRSDGAFLSELLTQKPLGKNTPAMLASIPFDLPARLRILGQLLAALDFIVHQPDFQITCYRDLRPNSIFLQYPTAEEGPVAQLFNFEFTKIPGSATKISDIKRGARQAPSWIDYASPELYALVLASQANPGTTRGFQGNVYTDIYSWGVIAWEMLTGVLPCLDGDAKLRGEIPPWPEKLDPAGRLSPMQQHLIRTCLSLDTQQRPSLASLRQAFP